MSRRDSIARFARTRTLELTRRGDAYYEWLQANARAARWPYHSVRLGRPDVVAEYQRRDGERHKGLNFTSQDYLALSSHPLVISEALAAVEQYGVHSAGSEPLGGSNPAGLELQDRIGQMLGMLGVCLFPTGWAAGFGAITGLVRDYDHVVLDAYSHDCLRQGAHAATGNVSFFNHNDVDHARVIVRRIREANSTAGILLVTESLFSMHADSPDLSALKSVCVDGHAYLLVDVAHDLGATGKDGLGQLGSQGMFQEVDIVVGAFSKCFASNGGFVAAGSASCAEYIRCFAGSSRASNALSPFQIGAVSSALRIVRSDEGAARRADLLARGRLLRLELEAVGLEILGDEAPFVLFAVPARLDGREVSTRLFRRGLVASLVEFPAVAVNETRFRLQLMSTHSEEQIHDAAGIIGDEVMS